MKIIRTSAAVATLAFSLGAFAHGGGPHFMGTVKAIEEGAIIVATKDKKEVRIAVVGETKYERSGQAASLQDLVSGERVVVHTAKPDKAGAFKAILVKFGAKPKVPPAGQRGDHTGHDGHAPAAEGKRR